MSATATLPIAAVRLRLARLRAKLFMSEAARIVGASVSFVRNIESGHRSIGAALARRLCDLYGVPSSWVFGGPWVCEGEEPPERPASSPAPRGMFLTAPKVAPPPVAVVIPPPQPGSPNDERERDYLERRYLSRPRQADEDAFLAETLLDVDSMRRALSTLMGRWFARTSDLPEFVPTSLAALALWLQAEREGRLSCGSQSPGCASRS